MRDGSTAENMVRIFKKALFDGFCSDFAVCVTGVIQVHDRHTYH